ncbi:MAG: hypothetical protein KA081_03900 [Leptotrichiaceae bacterium]|nr:hypothetical protein [Leptotrichiaceae bacterium]
MKKLLFFILILFGILSVQSFAWNYGCGENIPPDVCGAGGAGNSSNNGYTDYSKVPTVNQYLFIMPLNGNNYELIDLKTKDTGNALNWRSYYCPYPYKKNVACYLVDKVSYTAIVSSEDGDIFYGGADPRFNVSKGAAENYAKKECKKAKGKKCKLIMMIEPNFKMIDKRNNNITYLKITN